MCLGTFSAYPKVQMWGNIGNRKNPGFWPSPAPGDLIWVTLGQETYCISRQKGPGPQGPRPGPVCPPPFVPRFANSTRPPERARHSHILQEHRHLKYRSRHQNTSPDSPNTSPDIQNTSPDTENANPDTQYTISNNI